MGESFREIPVPLPDGRVVYMCCKEMWLQEPDQYVVVWVDTAKFLKQWDEYQHANCSLNDHGNRTRFPHAEDGFSKGRENPVPLSRVGMVRHPASGKLRLEGITRLVWLILNHASSFPVLCPVSESELLIKLCGKSSE